MYKCMCVCVWIHFAVCRCIDIKTNLFTYPFSFPELQHKVIHFSLKRVTAFMVWFRMCLCVCVHCTITTLFHNAQFYGLSLLLNAISDLITENMFVQKSVRIDLNQFHNYRHQQQQQQWKWIRVTYKPGDNLSIINFERWLLLLLLLLHKTQIKVQNSQLNFAFFSFLQLLNNWNP